MIDRHGAHAFELGRRVIVGTLVMLAAGCSDFRSSLNFDKMQGPDEFQVVGGRPLSVPADLSSLPPPSPGQPATTQVNVESEAVRAVFGGEAILRRNAVQQQTPGFARRSSGEQALLSQAGVNGADPNIRLILQQEATAAIEDTNVLDQVRFWQTQDQPLVDASAEAARLRKNVAEGRPLNEGEVPVSEQTTEGLLNNLFE